MINSEIGNSPQEGKGQIGNFPDMLITISLWNSGTYLRGKMFQLKLFFDI
jgi:hypothetical protein